MSLKKLSDLLIFSRCELSMVSADMKKTVRPKAQDQEEISMVSPDKEEVF